MPVIIGEQANPFCALGVTPHVNDAYLTTVGGDWEAYYAAKRSSSTRKTDRKKRKRLADHGETRFITAANRDDVVRSVDALIDEKRRSYAKLGVANMFEWPGYRDFFLEMASDPRSSGLTYVSRLDVGPDRGGELRADVPRPLLLHPGGLRRRRTGALRTRLHPAPGRHAPCP